VIAKVASELPGAFERAAAHGIVERAHRLAGAIVRVRYARAPLGFVDAALACPVETSQDPSLTVNVWATEEAGQGHRGASTYLRGQRIAGLHDGVSGAVSLFDAERAVAWCRFAAGPQPFHERATPLRFVLDAWATTRGLALLHAAAVGDARGGVLILGRGGAGKTTVALACDGLGIAGDDYVAVGTEPPHVHALYRTANVRVVGPEKDVIHLGDRACAGFPIRGLVLPRATARRSSALLPTTGAAAVRAGASLVLSDAGHPGALATLAALARAVPTHVLELGTEPAGIRAAMSESLA
jgi:hypothetical protein